MAADLMTVLANLGSQAAAFAPNVASAIILLVIGLVLGKVFGRIVREVLDRIRLDRETSYITQWIVLTGDKMVDLSGLHHSCVVGESSWNRITGDVGRGHKRLHS